MTTLDSPEAPEPSLTPTQEFSTCCMVRRKVCRACESFLTPKKNGYTCTKCQTWACSVECERPVVSVQCCRLTGVVSLGSPQSFYSEGPGGSSSSGMLCESENEGQAIDVQIAEVQDEEQAQGEWLSVTERQRDRETERQRVRE